MRLFTRYILREVVSHALLGGALFTFVLSMPYLLKILDLVVRDSASLWDTVRLFAYTLPNARAVTTVFVLADDRRPTGILHIHDLLRIGLG